MRDGAGLNEKGGHACGLRHASNTLTQREPKILPNFAYLVPAYLADGNWQYGFSIIISAI
jgi:hypothetical protein